MNSNVLELNSKANNTSQSSSARRSDKIKRQLILLPLIQQLKKAINDQLGKKLITIIHNSAFVAL